MKTIYVTTQAEWDALPDSTENTVIEIRGKDIEIRCRKADCVYAYGSSTVRAYGSSTVTAYGSSTVRAYDSSTVTACGSSTVTAYGSSTVRACDSSTVRACGSSTVRAYDSSTVTAYDSSTVRACDSSTVTAYDSSTVRAYDSSTVRAYDSSTVTAYDSSTVRASGANTIYVHSQYSTIDFIGLAIVFLKVLTDRVNGDRSRVFDAIPKPGVKAWAEREGVEVKDGAMVLYKRVSKHLKTQEGTRNETTWSIGETLEIANWRTPEEECGKGKFHACSLPAFCDQFRSETGDRYIAISVKVEDAHAWPGGSYPHKIAFRKGVVLHEVDTHGRKK
jgi:hypothetical protein